MVPTQAQPQQVRPPQQMSSGMILDLLLWRTRHPSDRHLPDQTFCLQQRLLQIMHQWHIPWPQHMTTYYQARRRPAISTLPGSRNGMMRGIPNLQGRRSVLVLSASIQSTKIPSRGRCFLRSSTYVLHAGGLILQSGERFVIHFRS